MAEWAVLAARAAFNYFPVRILLWSSDGGSEQSLLFIFVSLVASRWVAVGLPPFQLPLHIPDFAVLVKDPRTTTASTTTQ